jgi:Transcription factor WhiB
MMVRDRATCLGKDPELFFPIGNTGPALVQIEEAKAVWGRCEVVDTCLDWAIKSGQKAESVADCPTHSGKPSNAEKPAPCPGWSRLRAVNANLVFMGSREGPRCTSSQRVASGMAVGPG